MKKVLLFGATGNLGKEIARELKLQGYNLTVVLRDKSRVNMFNGIANHHKIADATDKDSLRNICSGFDVVVSALGKSVSPTDGSKPGFYAVDFVGNSNVLEEAVKVGIQKFVYVSALSSEKYLHLTYFKVHHDFSEKLKSSGLNYSIIKPPAIFSAYKDVITMAKKGQLINLGDGLKRTNPIYEGDLAKVCVDAIRSENTVIEAGGKKIYTRKQLNELILAAVRPGKKLKNVPVFLVTAGLPIIKLISKNVYDKFAFFIEVLQHDIVAPQVGDMSFEEYLKMQDLN
jgi:uncharacterized protein YbjT (DUF2867 family)